MAFRRQIVRRQIVKSCQQCVASLRREVGCHPRERARRPRVVEGPMQSVVPRAGCEHLAGLGGAEEAGCGPLGEDSEQRDVVDDKGHGRRAGLDRGEVLVLAPDLLHGPGKGAVGENLACELSKVVGHLQRRKAPPGRPQLSSRDSPSPGALDGQVEL